jgi:20S proteasome subunit beta 2
MALLSLDQDYNLWKFFDLKNFSINEKKFSAIAFFIKKTGTTICALVFDNGIILASDSRATNGEIICDSNCEKIHFIAPNICCCGAGTSADTENITKLVSHQLELQRISTGREILVKSAVSLLQKILFQHQGMLSAALILGGFDHEGFHLISIHPHGSTEKLPFLAMGSGSLASISILENLYKINLKIDQAIVIIQQSIFAGIYNDVGSGGSIDICIITQKNMKIFRNNVFRDSKYFKSNYFFSH